mgnify:CR=1 FL=1
MNTISKTLTATFVASILAGGFAVAQQTLPSDQNKQQPSAVSPSGSMSGQKSGTPTPSGAADSNMRRDRTDMQNNQRGMPGDRSMNSGDRSMNSGDRSMNSGNTGAGPMNSGTGSTTAGERAARNDRN